MKSMFWFLVGLAGGFAAAHLINRNPTGHELFAGLDARFSEFSERVGEAYRGQEARFDQARHQRRDAA